MVLAPRLTVKQDYPKNIPWLEIISISIEIIDSFCEHNSMSDEGMSRQDLIMELNYLRGIVESYQTTDRKHIDLGLNKVDTINLLHNIIEHIPSFVYAKDRQHRFIMINNAVAKLMGAKKSSDMIGKSDLDYWPEEMAKEYMADEDRVMETGSAIISKDEPTVSANGKIRWILTTKIPLRTPTGEIMGIIGIGHDITERKKLETERDQIIDSLKLALDRIKTLNGLLPICANCKKIRDDSGYWHQVERYIHDNTDASFTHGICPECAEKLYSEFQESQK